MNNRKFEWIYHLMLIPGMLFVIVFSIVPMFGMVIAFQKYIPAKGIFNSKWVQFDNFAYMFQLPDSKQIFINTVTIAVLKIIFGLIVPLVFALLLNEVRINGFKRTIQTIVYIPHFLSWVILAGILSNLLSLDGMVNKILEFFGFDAVFFMASNFWFRPIVIISDSWKEFGFGTIIYLAAITGVNPNMYESAVIDGANRFQQLWYITVPAILGTIVLLLTLSLGNVLNAGFDQIFNLYNPLVYKTGDIIDTYVFRVGLTEAQFGLASAVGLMKSVISFALILVSYRLASRYANYRIF